MKKQTHFLRDLGLLLSFTIAITSTAFSQKYQMVNQNLIPENQTEMNKSVNQSKKLNDLFAELDGTYQIQYTQPDYKILLSETLYNKIKELRKEKEKVVIQLDQNSKLYLPSYNEIEKHNYKKLTNSLYISK